MWAARVGLEVPTEAVTGRLRMECLREIMWSGRAPAAARAAEQAIYRGSNGCMSVYTSMILWWQRNQKASPEEITRQAAEGDSAGRAVIMRHRSEHERLVEQVQGLVFTSKAVISRKRCRKCRKVGTIKTVGKQTRSGDEGMTGKFICESCGHQETA